MQFDVSTLPSDIASAKLYLYATANCGGGSCPAMSWTVKSIASPWNEMTATWNTRPTLGGSYGTLNIPASPTGIANARWVSVDITNLYNGWKNGTITNYGIGFTRLGSTWDGGVWLNKIASSDYDTASLRPKLVIQSARLISPLANAEGPYIGNEGSPITFDGSGSYDLDGTIVLYEWDLDGDGLYDDGLYDDATGANPSYTWNDDYTGTIGLKVTDDGGLTDTSSTIVTVNNVPPTANAGLDQTVFAGDTVNFTGSFTDPGWLDTHTALWDFTVTEENNPPDATGQVTGSHIYYNKGTYTVTLTVTDDDGGIGIDTLQVIVKPIPATIRIEPETLNLASKGVFTVFITFPEGYDMANVNLSTVVCKGAPAVKGIVSEEDKGTYVVKFNRQDLVDVPIGEAVTLTVTGKVGLADFEGSDTIRVINQGKK